MIVSDAGKLCLPLGCLRIVMSRFSGRKEKLPKLSNSGNCLIGFQEKNLTPESRNVGCFCRKSVC